ncbi:MAG TPA: hypothetical protein VFC00_14610 [Micromonosporaceae bacterium]|nr:hypothetical protein [Micromonosporaceae bacterium]
MRLGGAYRVLHPADQVGQLLPDGVVPKRRGLLPGLPRVLDLAAQRVEVDTDVAARVPVHQGPMYRIGGRMAEAPVGHQRQRHAGQLPQVGDPQRLGE